MLLMRLGKVFRYFSLVADRERALWASKFVTVIATHQPPSSIFGPSLIDTLLASQIDIEKYKKAAADPKTPVEGLDTLIEDEMKEMFIKGV